MKSKWKIKDLFQETFSVSVKFLHSTNNFLQLNNFQEIIALKTFFSNLIIFINTVEKYGNALKKYLNLIKVIKSCVSPNLKISEREAHFILFYLISLITLSM